MPYDATQPPHPNDPTLRVDATDRRRPHAGGGSSSAIAWLIPGLAIAFYANGQAAHRGARASPAAGLRDRPAPLRSGGVGSTPRAWPARSAGDPAVQRHASSQCVPLVSPVWRRPASCRRSGSLVRLAWLSHIVMDWAMGDGLRERRRITSDSAQSGTVDRSRFAAPPPLHAHPGCGYDGGLRARTPGRAGRDQWAALMDAWSLMVLRGFGIPTDSSPARPRHPAFEKVGTNR